MLQQTLEWIQNLGFIAPIIFILIYIIATVLLISGAILTLGAGLIFGLLPGFFYVSIASTLGATIAFLIGRYLARGWVTKQIDNKPKFKAIDSAVAQQGWKIVGLTRLSPIFPFVFLNYAFSITQVSLKDYILASWLGMLPGTMMYVYIGSLAKDLASLATTTPENNNLIWILRLVGLLATVVVTIYITRIAKQALDSQIIQKS